MPEYDRWYKSVLEGKKKCFYPNRISLLETPGVPLFLYHTDFQAIVGEATINRAEVRNGAHFYFFNTFIKYSYPVPLELIRTDERVPKMARAGRWTHFYISRETVEEIRSLSQMSEEMKAELGIDLEKVLARLEKRPAVRKPGWRVFMEEEIGKLREAYHLDDQILERLREYFSGAASRKITKGRTMREVFYASLYLTLRMLEYPVRLLDIQEMSNIKSGKLAKNYHLLVRKLGLNPPPICPEKIVLSHSRTLNIRKQALSLAVSIIESARREGATSGSGPFSIAATATYLACQAEDEKATQKEIGEVFGVTPVSIRNNVKKLNRFVKSSNL